MRTPCDEARPPARDATVNSPRPAEKISLQALSPRRYPHVLEAALPLTSCDNSRQWRAGGLDLLLRGLRELQPSG